MSGRNNSSGTPPLILVTRPIEEAKTLAASLTERGCIALIEPLLRIRYRPLTIETCQAFDPENLSALLFTSSNGVRAWSDLVGIEKKADTALLYQLPIFTVGKATEAVARAVGFTKVQAAAGSVESLAHLVTQHLDPQTSGDLLHIAGTVLAGDLAHLLGRAGFKRIRRATLYEAIPSPSLSPTVCAALAYGELNAALFFSPRTAAHFVVLIQQALPNSQACAWAQRLVALCLSQAVATALHPLPFHARHIAAEPSQDALLALIDRNAHIFTVPPSIPKMRVI